MSSMTIRIITGLGILAIVGLSVSLSVVSFLLFQALVLLLAIPEWLNLFTIQKTVTKFVFSVLYLLVLLIPVLFEASTVFYYASYVLVFALWPLYIAHIFYPKLIKDSVYQAVFPILALVLSAATWAAVVWLTQSSFAEYLMVLLMIPASDIFAYFIGKHFGQRKLIPEVSPSKTWLGAFAGITIPIALVFVACPHLIREPMWLWLCCFTLTLIIGIFGDLSMSRMKRRVNLKDTGALLPGHGGILDRIDSLLFAIPFYAVCVLLLGI